MELIKNKYDDLNNRIRPGSVFVGTRTDNLKFIDKDGAEAELVPLSRYFAKETILRGQPISIAQLSDLTDDEAADRYAYVKVTDPDVDTSCIGLALNYAEAGQVVQIQRYGTFSFLTKASSKYKKQAEAGTIKEVFIDADAGFLFDKVRGQKLYLKKVSSVYDNDHDSKNQNSVSEASVSSITYDYMDSVYTAKNTIQIGQLTDAPTVKDDDDQVVTIELDVTGDTRGPIDHTQFIVTLGEDIEFQAVDKDQTLTEPYNDEGIFNEVKVLALADRDPEKALFSIVPKTAVPNTVNTKAPLAFIGVRKLGGKSVIIPLSYKDTDEKTARTFDDICNVQTNDNDIGYLKLLKSKYNSDQSDPVIMDPVDLSQTTVKNYAGALKNAIKAALEALDSEAFKDASTTMSSTVIDKETAVEEWQIEAAKAKGYFDLYESSELVRFFNIKTLKHGTEAPKGTAILADIRDANRCNVIGVVVDNFNGVHKAGSTIKVMRAGRFFTTGNMKVGAEYFLGLNGRITTKSQYWYDTNVKIGTVETDHNLIVNVQEIQHDFSGSLEMGFVKSCAGLVPEKGYVLMDGVTRLEKAAYKDFYEYLLGIYSASELYAYKLDDEKNVTEEIDDNYFIVPRVVMDDGKTVCQIKYLPNGIYHNLPRAPFLRFYGTIDANNKVESRDITRLVHYGTLEQSRIAPTLENVDIRLFVREPENKLFPIEGASDAYADKYIWREMQPGFHVYNNDTVYGFDWVVKQNDYEGTDGLYVLEIETNQGLGICKINAQGQPIPMKNAEYKLIVTAKNLWTREYSLLDTTDVADSMELNTDDIAPSVNTIREYYEKEVDTRTLNVADGQLVSNEKGTTIKNLTINKTTLVDEDGKSLEDRDTDFAEHVVRTATYVNEKGKVEGVHGLINLGAQGNLDAKSLAGLQLSDGNNNLTEDADPTKCWIPFVSSEDSSSYTEFNTGTKTVAHLKDGTEMYSEDVTYAKSKTSGNIDAIEDILKLENVSGELSTAIKQYTKDIQFGDDEFKAILSSDTNALEIVLSDGSKDVNISGLGEVKAKGLTIGGTKLTQTMIDAIAENFASSIAFKKVYSEKIDPSVKAYLNTTRTEGEGDDKKEVGNILVPNTNVDANGNPTSNLDTSKLADGLQLDSLTKFGSALQALYEMPLSIFEYNYGNGEYKEQLGILIERINQIRDNIESGKANFAHKVNSFVKSSNKVISDYTSGVDTVYGDEASIRAANNSYEYTADEAKSISNYLDLITSKKELSQELRSTVAILMAAAQETQKRLLDVETSVFGFDAPTIPGDKTNQETVSKRVSEDLRGVINNSPLLLGLNRLIRAICLELYDTTDLETIDSETTKILEDSDTLRDKVTVKSRIDQVDTILTDLMYRYNGLVRMEMTSITQGETHNTWEPLVDTTNENKEVESEEKSEKSYDEESNEDKDVTPLSITASDTHTREGQVDKSTTWKTLPSTEDVKEVVKNTVAFAKVYDGAGKHSPSNNDCGIVRVPVTETVEMQDENSGTGNITVTKIKYDAKTGLPVYKEKGVAFLDSKVERMNLKLSEITKTIYGNDDVTAQYPNRTEVLRRNISNLIDDLYPNKSFKAENVLSNGLYNPFVNSTKDGGSKTIDQVATNSNNEGVTNRQSIIKPIIDQLFTFTSENKYLSAFESSDTNKGVIGTHNNKPAGFTDNPSKISWNAYGLSTTSATEANNFNSTTLSQLDWIKEALGIDETISASALYDSNTLWTILLNYNSYATMFDVKSSASSYWSARFKAELAFKDKKVSETDSTLSWATMDPSDSILNATMVSSMLSRKAKSLERRLTTVEASLDDFANFATEVKRIADDDECYDNLSQYSKHTDRFEKTELATSLETMVKSMVYGKNEMFVFDKEFFQRSMDWGETAVDSVRIWDHNKKVMDEIDKQFKVLSKTVGSSNCDYTLKCKKAVTPFTTTLTKKSDGFYYVTVTHVDSAPESLDANTIYLKGTTVNPTNVRWAHQAALEGESSVGNLSDVDGVGLAADLSTKNMLLQMKALAKDLAQTQFDMAHPIGTIFTRTVPSGQTAETPTTPEFGPNPYGIDIGVWELLNNDTLIGTGADSANGLDSEEMNIVSAKESDYVVSETPSNVKVEESKTLTATLTPKSNDVTVNGYNITLIGSSQSKTTDAVAGEFQLSKDTTVSLEVDNYTFEMVLSKGAYLGGDKYTIAAGKLSYTVYPDQDSSATIYSTDEAAIIFKEITGSSSSNTPLTATVVFENEVTFTSDLKISEGTSVNVEISGVSNFTNSVEETTTYYKPIYTATVEVPTTTNKVIFTADSTKSYSGVVEDPLNFAGKSDFAETSTSSISGILEGSIDVELGEKPLTKDYSLELTGWKAGLSEDSLTVLTGETVVPTDITSKVSNTATATVDLNWDNNGSLFDNNNKGDDCKIGFSGSYTRNSTTDTINVTEITNSLFTNDKATTTYPTITVDTTKVDLPYLKHWNIVRAQVWKRTALTSK